MNIHEHQAKDILREFEAPVPKGVVVYNIKEINQKIKNRISCIFYFTIKKSNKQFRNNLRNFR